MIIYNPNKIELNLEYSRSITDKWQCVGGFTLGVLKPTLRIEIMLRKTNVRGGRLESTIDLIENGERRRGWGSEVPNEDSPNNMAYCGFNGKLLLTLGFKEGKYGDLLTINYHPLDSSGGSNNPLEKNIKVRPRFMRKLWFPCKHKRSIHSTRIS